MKAAAVIHMLSPRNFKTGSYTRRSRHLAVVHGGGLAYIYIYFFFFNTMSPFFWKGGPWNKGPDFGLHKFASLNRKARRKAPLLEGRSKQDRIMPAVQNFGSM